MKSQSSHSQSEAQRSSIKANSLSENKESTKNFVSNLLQILQKKQKLGLNPSIKSSDIIKQIDQDFINYGLGAMFGAFIGDALGSYLQFETIIKEDQANKAMKMPGGGRAFPFLLPGMFTDDSQLASHLLKALLDYDATKKIQQQEKSLLFQIASQYDRWYNLGPFDIGHTTRAALRQIKQAFDLNQEMADSHSKKQDNFDNFIKPSLKDIALKNKSSESNGSLMRITPMAFFISLVLENSKEDQIQFKDFHNLVRNQINMTHGSETIYQTSEAYIDLLVSLIRRPKSKLLKQVYQDFKQKYQESKDQSIKHVREWINDLSKPISATNSMGWAKIAFTHTLRNLEELIKKQENLNENKQPFMNPDTYKNLIKSVLNLGGDTDTNGAIVGGLIGAVLGFKNLPIEYLKKQFQVNIGSINNEWLKKRTQYEPFNTFLNAIKMIQNINQKTQQ